MSDRFSPQDLREAQGILALLFEEVRDEEGPLSGGTKLRAGGTTLQSLRETKLTFGNPRSELIKLTRRLFDDIGVDLTEIRKQQMRDHFDFYFLSLSVSLRPVRGAHFGRLECELKFGPKGPQEPVIQAIFPRSEWRELLSWGGTVNLALNSNIDWGVEVNVLDPSMLQGLPGHLRANVASKGKLGAFIAIPDYSFKLGRTEIAATGTGDSECFWRLENPELKETQTAQFAVVFTVPKGTTSIELTGLVAAEPEMNWLVSNVSNVLGGLSDSLQRLLRLRDEEREGKERLPIGDYEEWTIELPV